MQLALQLLHLKGDGGLGIVQLLRRLQKAAALQDGLKGHQIFQLHRLTNYSILSNSFFLSFDLIASFASAIIAGSFPVRNRKIPFRRC